MRKGGGVPAASEGPLALGTVRERASSQGRGHRAGLAASRTLAGSRLARLSHRERALTQGWHTAATESTLPFLPGQLYALPLSPLTSIPLVLPQLLLTTLIDSDKNQYHRSIRLIIALPTVPFLMQKTGFFIFLPGELRPAVTGELLETSVRKFVF